jgi:hypothetical protein
LQVKEELSRKFKMKNLGDFTFFSWHGNGKGSCTTFASTKLDILRRFSNTFLWRITKPSKCHLIPRQS